MYVPAPYATEEAAALAVARRHPFGTIISTGPDGWPHATWIPFLVDDEAQPPRIFGHMARANDHWRAWTAETPLLAVFAGPHHYISPTWYANGPSVPTWNYLLTHVHGRPRLLDPVADAAEVRWVLGSLVTRMEGSSGTGWRLEEQPDDYVAGMARGVAAFELVIDRIEGQTKLSQAKPEADRAGAIAALEALGGDDASAIAGLMRAAPPHRQT